MIQRIQSLYLFLALVFMITLLFLPVIRFIGPEGQNYLFLVKGVKLAGTNDPLIIRTYPLLILYIIIPLLSTLTIFLYKNRMLQIRISIFNILLMVGSLGLLYYYLRECVRELTTEPTFSIPVIFPLISAILTYIAYRGIRKDEEIIRSYDRIR